MPLYKSVIPLHLEYCEYFCLPHLIKDKSRLEVQCLQIPLAEEQSGEVNEGYVSTFILQTFQRYLPGYWEKQRN